MADNGFQTERILKKFSILAFFISAVAKTSVFGLNIKASVTEMRLCDWSQVFRILKRRKHNIFH